ncbi:MAG TPA: PQQ-dependent sugar dehydrogenase, partial [Actinoplanes sp.]|nr:PQQ-dependent sugar dehydrogenase [Actinoplanes sp.]
MTGSRLGLAVVTASVALLAACSSDDTDRPQPPAPSIAVAPSGPESASPAAAPSGTPDLGAPETLATGIDVPWGLAFLPDGSALVAQRDRATILQVTPGAQPREAYRVPGVDPGGEGGLLGLAMARDYARTQWVYAYYTS